SSSLGRGVARSSMTCDIKALSFRFSEEGVERGGRYGRHVFRRHGRVLGRQARKVCSPHCSTLHPRDGSNARITQGYSYYAAAPPAGKKKFRLCKTTWRGWGCAARFSFGDRHSWCCRLHGSPYFLQFVGFLGCDSPLAIGEAI